MTTAATAAPETPTTSPPAASIEVESGLRVLFWASLVGILFPGIDRLLALASLPGDFLQLFDSCETTCALLFLLGLARIATLPEPPGRRLARRALLAFAAALLLRPAVSLFDLATPHYDTGPIWGYVHTALTALSLGAGLAGWTLLVVGPIRRARAAERLTPLDYATLGAAALRFLLLLWQDLRPWSFPLPLATVLLPEITLIVILGLHHGALRRARRAAAPPVDPTPVAELPGWRLALPGLATLFRANLAKVIFLVAGTILFSIAVALFDPRDAQAFLWLAILLLGYAVPSLYVLRGLLRYTFVPVASGARGRATVAFAFALAAFVTDIAGLLGTVNDLLHDQHLGDRLLFSQSLSLVPALVSLLLLLGSLRRAATFTGALDLARRARRTWWFVLSIPLLQLLSLVLSAMLPRHSEPLPFLPTLLAIPVAITSLVMVLRLIYATSRRLIPQ